MRLTKKDKRARYGYKYVAPNKFDNFGEGCNKLGKLEDVEEELGIDLIIFFKAITEGFYVKTNDFMKAHYHFSPCLFKTNNDYERANEYIIEYGKHFIFLKDYGKTWALTKEELL